MQDELTIPTSIPEDFEPTPKEGLSEKEAERRRQTGQDNKSSADQGKTVGRILAENLFTFFNLLNLALAACLIAVGSYRNMLFLGVVVSNALIGTVQELRARHTIRKLRLLNTPMAHAIREGKESTLKPEELVQGDLVILRAGDQVPADAIVMEGVGAANEAMLTGESDAVSKRVGDWLMSGSYLTEGRFVAQLERVGNDSYIHQLTRSAKEIKRPHSALMTDLNRLLRWVSAILVPLGLLLFAKQYFLLHAPLIDAVPASVAAMLGMIPEGLILLTSVAMAVGVVKLGRKNTLVQELYGIETLARVDVLCLDKTGTITTGNMTLTETIPLEADEAEMRRAASSLLGAFDIAGGTLKALGDAIIPGEEKPTAVLPFSSQRKKSAASFPGGVTYILGAPSFVLDEEMYAGEIRRKTEEAAALGARVLALAEAKGEITGSDTPPVSRVLGLFLLADELRPGAAETLEYFRAQGVSVKVISGDDPRTVSAIARRVNLPGWQDWVDATELQSPDKLKAACERCTVFGRVTPSQKKQLVEALKQAGHSVAMTGDGVNDIPALKAADCSIAMPGGSDAAKHTAQLTLLDADFASMPLVVGEGRRVINNITRAASLFLVKTLYSFALSILMLALPTAYPFQPIQLTLISSLTIGIPSFFLALEPNNERIRGSFLQTVLTRAVPGAAAVTLCAVLSMMGVHLGWNIDTCSTLATLSAGTIGLMILAGVCYPFTRLRAAVITAMTAAFILAVLFFGHVFFLMPLPPAELLMLGGLCVMGLGVMLFTRQLMKRRIEHLQHVQG